MSTALNGIATIQISKTSLGFRKLGFNQKYNINEEAGANIIPNLKRSPWFKLFSPKKLANSNDPLANVNIAETKK